MAETNHVPPRTTAAARRGSPREQLEKARAAAFGTAHDFHRLCEVRVTRLSARKLSAAADRVMVAADERRGALRAMEIR